jgi:hypothetical protein
LATQTTASVDPDPENQMPRYLLVDAPGEKNPRINVPSDETRVLPSVMLAPLLRVSSAKADLGEGRATSSDKRMTRWLKVASMI